jgi:branched-chain amino acid transport system ATP-binding protein
VLLELKNVSVFYDKVQAVKNVSLVVGEGEIVTIMGSNGAGKTSTLCAISGVVFRRGEIWFEGERIDKLSPPEIAAKGIIHIPEGGKLFPLLSVMDNLRMGAYLRKNKKEIQTSLQTTFELFPILKSRLNQRADSLSGGERSMLAMGRALMAHPKFILMDEPTLGLSPVFCQKLEKKIKEIHRDQIAILFVAQNARMALRLSSRGYVFEKGQCVLEGKSEDLVKDEDIKRAYLGI